MHRIFVQNSSQLSQESLQQREHLSAPKASEVGPRTSFLTSTGSELKGTERTEDLIDDKIQVQSLENMCIALSA